MGGLMQTIVLKLLMSNLPAIRTKTKTALGLLATKVNLTTDTAAPTTADRWKQVGFALGEALLAHDGLWTALDGAIRDLFASKADAGVQSAK